MSKCILIKGKSSGGSLVWEPFVEEPVQPESPSTQDTFNINFKIIDFTAKDFYSGTTSDIITVNGEKIEDNNNPNLKNLLLSEDFKFNVKLNDSMKQKGYLILGAFGFPNTDNLSEDELKEKIIKTNNSIFIWDCTLHNAPNGVEGPIDCVFESATFSSGGVQPNTQVTIAVYINIA